MADQGINRYTADARIQKKLIPALPPYNPNGSGGYNLRPRADI